MQTVAEYAKSVGKSRFTIYRWIKAGRIKVNEKLCRTCPITIMGDFSEEWKAGFDAGYAWCESLSKDNTGNERQFFPDQKGAYRNGFAEGTITGRHKFNVTWRWVDPENRPNIVVRGPEMIWL